MKKSKWISKVVLMLLIVTPLSNLTACGTNSEPGDANDSALEKAPVAAAPDSRGASVVAEPGMPPEGSGQGPPGGKGAVDASLYRNKWLDVVYAAESDTQKMDIYLPDEGKGPFPLVVAVHGGGWSSGDKTGAMVLPSLNAIQRGYAVACVNYRLSGEAHFPAQIYDIKAAIRFLRANAVDYNLNPDKIALWGDSAGAHLAALAGTSADAPELMGAGGEEKTVSDRVQAVVAWYPLIDVSIGDREDAPERMLFGRPMAEVPELVRNSNPETYITPDDPPFFIEHGDKDQAVPVQQSIHFAAALEPVLGKDKVHLKIIEGAGHVDKAFETPENISLVLDFLDSVFRI